MTTRTYNRSIIALPWHSMVSEKTFLNNLQIVSLHYANKLNKPFLHHFYRGSKSKICTLDSCLSLFIDQSNDTI